MRIRGSRSYVFLRIDLVIYKCPQIFEIEHLLYYLSFNYQILFEFWPFRTAHYVEQCDQSSQPCYLSVIITVSSAYRMTRILMPFIAMPLFIVPSSYQKVEWRKYAAVSHSFFYRHGIRCCLLNSYFCNLMPVEVVTSPNSTKEI